MQILVIEWWPQGVVVLGLSKLPRVLPSLWRAELLLAPAVCGTAPLEGSQWPGNSRELQSLK